MKIYTKTGDKGQTSLYDGTRVSKGALRVESYGTVDEVVSYLGVAKNYIEDEEVVQKITDIQNKLFTVAAVLANTDKSKAKVEITEADIEDLEKIVDHYLGSLEEIRGFIVPGSNKPSAFLHVARTVCRRAERCIIRLMDYEEVDEMVVKYVNRLADAIYAFASYFERERQRVKF